MKKFISFIILCLLSVVVQAATLKKVAIVSASSSFDETVRIAS